MTTEQENHLQSIKNSFNQLVDSKYRKGQAEHGGDLFSLGLVSLIDMAIEEAIDQVVYLLTVRDKVVGVKSDPKEKPPYIQVDMNSKIAPYWWCTRCEQFFSIYQPHTCKT